MKILALEFSSAQRSVAVWEGAAGPHAGLLGRSQAVEAALAGAGNPGGGTGSRRNTPAFALIEAALQQARCEREDIGCLAVGLGPGSYTGIRMAIAIAQGWELARPVKVLGLSSVECMAAQLHAQGRQGRYTIGVDAQRNEFYLASYEVTGCGWREIESLRLAPFAELGRRADKGEQLAGPELMQSFPGAHDLFPDAAALARLAASRTDFLPSEKLEPIYLRPTAFVKARPPLFP